MFLRWRVLSTATNIATCVLIHTFRHPRVLRYLPGQQSTSGGVHKQRVWLRLLLLFGTVLSIGVVGECLRLFRCVCVCAHTHACRCGRVSVRVDVVRVSRAVVVRYANISADMLPKYDNHTLCHLLLPGQKETLDSKQPNAICSLPIFFAFYVYDRPNATYTFMYRLDIPI